MSRVELRIERLAAGGDGVGREPGGRVVFVPCTAPGDLVRVRLVRERKRHAHGELEQLLEPGPSRRDPACELFGRCGGCSWLHVGEGEQRVQRLEILRHAIERLAGLRLPGPIEWLASPRSLGYRARARVARAGGAIGFRRRASREVVDVKRCPILTPRTQEALERLREATPGGAAGRTDEVELVGFAAPLGLRVSEGAFFQANEVLWADWRERVVEACGTGACVLELYAGVGFYTVLLEQRFREVVAIEGGRAVCDLAHNSRATVIATSAEEFARNVPSDLEPDVVLVNPPREGCRREVLGSLLALDVPRFVYVSCDTATLARDLRILSVSYHLESVVGIDAAPQTSQIEALVTLVRT